ncbi:hypothetical protein DMUE_2301 [Dictyocoela muelleri]|nr:hypothetical protein DMUE_2301 [Dictyocoela muelleri]
MRSGYEKEKNFSIEFILFYCNYCDTTKRRNLFTNSLGTKIPILKLIKFSYYFTLNIEGGIICEMLELDPKTVNSIVLKIQKLLSTTELISVPIGGPETIVNSMNLVSGRKNTTLEEMVIKLGFLEALMFKQRNSLQKLSLIGKKQLWDLL